MPRLSQRCLNSVARSQDRTCRKYGNRGPFVGRARGNSLQRVRPGASSQSIVSPREVGLRDLEIQRGLMLSLILGVYDLLGVGLALSPKARALPRDGCRRSRNRRPDGRGELSDSVFSCDSRNRDSKCRRLRSVREVPGEFSPSANRVLPSAVELCPFWCPFDPSPS